MTFINCSNQPIILINDRNNCKFELILSFQYIPQRISDFFGNHIILNSANAQIKDRMV